MDAEKMWRKFGNFIASTFKEGKMQHFEHVVTELGRNAATFEHLLHGLEDAQIQWRPTPDKWNLLEIVCHLLDEEREDFKQRVRQTLEDPTTAPPSIDPEGWVLTRGYAERDYEAVLMAFMAERQQSLRWLRSLKDPQWGNTWEHPQWGPLSAAMFLNSWLAHDYLHIRQIIQRKFGYLQAISKENLQYAGAW